MSPYDRPASMRAAREFVITGSRYSSVDEAQAEAEAWCAALQSAFARVAIGADFGGRAPHSYLTQTGIDGLQAEHGRRVLNDVHGTTVYECEPAPLFARLGSPQWLVHKPEDKVRNAIAFAIVNRRSMSSHEQLAYDLFSASFFQPSADGRFVMLMMAVETLIEQESRSNRARDLVDEFIRTVERSGLETSEQTSLVGSLKALQRESIGQAGRRLAASLGDRSYMGERPTRFFSECYDLRSQLVHGADPRPSQEEIGARAAQLELFVGHLLSGPLLEGVPD